MNTCTCFKDNEEYTIGGICRAGVHFDYISENGYKSSVTTYDTNVERNLHRMANGGFFIDARNVEDPYGYALYSPMLELDKPSDWKERENPGGFSYVGLSYFLNNAAKYGAKIGMRVNDKMHWNDGEITHIAPCECWKDVCLGCHKLRSYVDIVSTGGYFTNTRIPTNPHDHCPSCKANGVK